MAINKYTSDGENSGESSNGGNGHVIRRTVMNGVHAVTDLKVFTVATQHGKSYRCVVLYYFIAQKLGFKGTVLQKINVGFN